MELMDKEMEDWTGLVSYISHQEVLKPGSKSTKLHIVSNSSLVNNNNSISLNDCLVKGLPSIISLLEAIIAWRMYARVCCWDYTKCYNLGTNRRPLGWTWPRSW